MKTISTKKLIPSFMLAALLTLFVINAQAQNLTATNLHTGKALNISRDKITGTDSVATLDTMLCMFHQVMTNSAHLSWRKGYIVLENDKIMIGNVSYPTLNASHLTGLIQNKFLSSNRKKVVKSQVIQVVLLQ
ncbi:MULTISPECIES: hypothetical protein [unclassified Mucilaginibacter]|uniref:hypothetical protein n=1 Tax=unclassified Mucilaginibacter TaxID=2617802 RepID=UPI0031F62B1A